MMMNIGLIKTDRRIKTTLSLTYFIIYHFDGKSIQEIASRHHHQAFGKPEHPHCQESHPGLFRRTIFDETLPTRIFGLFSD